jgi:hypothetical protein
MSYMEHNAAFAPAGEIQELSFDEIEEVGGGPLPLIAIAYAGIALNIAVLSVGYSWVAGVRTGYHVNLK